MFLKELMRSQTNGPKIIKMLYKFFQFFCEKFGKAPQKQVVGDPVSYGLIPTRPFFFYVNTTKQNKTKTFCYII